MNGPPSSCQVVMIGSWSSRAGRSTTSVTGAREVLRVPSLRNSNASERCCQSLRAAAATALRYFYQFTHKIHRFRAEGKLNAPARAKEVCTLRETGFTRVKSKASPPRQSRDDELPRARDKDRPQLRRLLFLFRVLADRGMCGGSDALSEGV